MGLTPAVGSSSNQNLGPCHASARAHGHLLALSARQFARRLAGRFFSLKDSEQIKNLRHRTNGNQSVRNESPHFRFLLDRERGWKILLVLRHETHAFDQGYCGLGGSAR